MPHTPEIRMASIVLRGHFTPAIFQPSWLASQNLLRTSEAEAAKIELIHPKAAVFSADWLQLSVLEDRFHASTSQVPYFEALRDLAAGAFAVLDQTPVRALGINQSFHFPLGSEDKLHQLGHKLAPQEPWKAILRSPGLLSLTMQTPRSDNYEGYVRVQVEPSNRVKFGVFVDVNDHYQLATQEAKPGTGSVVSILGSGWVESITRAVTVSQGILEAGGS